MASTSSPAMSGPSLAARCASAPAIASAWPASITAGTKGSGASARPSASVTRTASARPSPAPPSFSENGMPVHPSAAISFHSGLEYPSGSPPSRSVRARDRGDLSATNAAAVVASIDWSSVSASCMGRSSRGRSVGEREHLLGDDVELDLRRPPLDRVAARPQPLARLRELLGGEALPLPPERLGAADRDHELVPPLVQLGAVHLEQRRLGPRSVPGL